MSHSSNNTDRENLIEYAAILGLIAIVALVALVFLFGQVTQIISVLP